MRLRIVIPVLAIGLLVAAAGWLLRPGGAGPGAPNRPPTVVAAPPEGVAPSPGAPLGSPKPGLAPMPTPAAPGVAASHAPPPDSPEAKHQAYVQERVDQLMDLAMDDQPASLQIILGELTNRDPEIRQAAIQATMQFDSRDAIPKLREAADQTDDLREKAAILEAIQFLETPSPAEVAPGPQAAPAPPPARPGFKKP